MAFDPPDGILDIGNATLRVGKLEVAETSGLNQGLQNIIKNDLLVTENTEYTTNQKWGLKLPTTWVAEFEVKGHSGKYIDFNFYNENSASNAQGYNLTFMDTSLTLKYDGGNNLPITGDTVDSTLSPGDAGYGVATIPTIVGAYRKVNIFFERGVISVSIDGTRYLYHKESDGFNQGLGVASRVVSATGSAFVNLFIEQNAANSAFKNLRIVNGRFISDKTSNIAFIGGNLGVGVNSPKEALDIRGNMHFNRVSNVSSVSVDSNVVTEYTGPHDRPLRKYPEVALTADDNSSTSGYKASVSSILTGNDAFRAFDATGATSYWHSQYPYYTHATGTYNPGQSSGGVGTPSGTLPTTQLVSGHQGEWIKLQMPTRIKLEEVRVYASSRAAAGTNVYQMPKDIAIAGSNDGTNWYLVDSGTLRTGIRESYGMTSLPVTTSSYYSYLALIVKTIDNQGANYSAVEIANIEYYGREEGSGSLDTTLKTVYNVPATTGTQLEVYYDGQNYTSGTTVNDLALPANNGTLNGGVGFDSTYKAFTFDGTDDYILTDITNPEGAFVHSVSTWVKADNLNSGNITQIGKGADAHTKRLQFSLTAIDGVRGQINMGLQGSSVKFKTNLQVGVWNHLVYTYNGGAAGAESTSYNMYVNGVSIPVGGGNGTGVLNFDANAKFAVGGHHLGTSGFYFTGSIANVRLYSKVLNAGQIKELYDYQKDYFLGSKSQVTLYKGHLGVGVTEPSGQLELAGDERIQEYPPRALTGYETLVEGHGVFCASASSDLGLSYTNPYDAFSKATSVWITGDGSYSSGLATNVNTFQGVNGAWLKLKLPYKINLKKFKIQGRNGSNERFIDAILYASTDDNNWDQLRNIEMPASYDYATGVDFDAPNTSKYYNYFLIQITKVQTGTGQVNYANIGEWRLFGTPGPTTIDKGSLTLGRSLDVPRVSRYDVDTETPRPEKLVVDFDTTVNSSPTDISGQGNHGTFYGSGTYSAADKAFDSPNSAGILVRGSTLGSGAQPLTLCAWAKGTGDWNATANDTIIGIGPNSSSGHSSFQLCVNTDAITLDMASASNFVEYPVTITNHRWYFIAMTYTGGDAFTNTRVYVDGVEIAKPASWTNGTSATLALPSNPDIGVGTRTGNGSGTTPAGFLAGMISNPKIYNVALEPSEVKKLYKLGRTGRSMVISDTAVGIGKVPEAQLDVRGVANFERVGIGVDNPGKTLDVNGTTRSRKNAGWKSGTFDSTGVNMGPLADGTTDGAQIGWEFHVTFSAATGGSRVEIYGAYKHSGPLYAANEKWTFRFKEGVGTPDYSNYAELVNEAEPNADTYYAVIRVVNSIYNNTNVVAARHHFMSHSVGCHRSIGATIWQAQGYIDMGGESIDDRFNYLRLTSSSGNIKGQWTVFPITT